MLSYDVTLQLDIRNRRRVRNHWLIKDQGLWNTDKFIGIGKFGRSCHR